MLIKSIEYITIAEVIDMVKKKIGKGAGTEKFCKLDYKTQYEIVKEYIIRYRLQEEFQLLALIDWLDFDIKWEEFI